jgi:perosamine synthetase
VYLIRPADRFSQADRDAVLEHPRREGIGCDNYFVPIHMQPRVMEMLGTRAGDFQAAERIAARTIALPVFAELSPRQADRCSAGDSPT